jgi:hypothetical protein
MYRWKYNIKGDLKLTGCRRMDWIQLAQSRTQRQIFVKMEIDPEASCKVVNFLTGGKLLAS